MVVHSDVVQVFCSCLLVLAVMCLVMKIFHSLMLTGCFSKKIPNGEIVVPMAV